MTTARVAGAFRAPALVASVGCAAMARMAIGGPEAAASVPAAVVFVAVLGTAVVVAGQRVAQISWRSVAAGVGAAAVLVGLSLTGVPVVLGGRATATTLAWWVPLVALVAAVEELVFRGVLFDAVRIRAGETAAVAITAALFAVIHLPLYGPVALPIDLCVGVFLGCLRVASRSVAAPLLAHVLADVATGWVG